MLNSSFSCYIYTFDSLGGKHNAAAKHLGQYLRHEAVDKKKFQMEDTSVAIGKAAKVWLLGILPCRDECSCICNTFCSLRCRTTSATVGYTCWHSLKRSCEIPSSLARLFGYVV